MNISLYLFIYTSTQKEYLKSGPFLSYGAKGIAHKEPSCPVLNADKLTHQLYYLGRVTLHLCKMGISQNLILGIVLRIRSVHTCYSVSNTPGTQ